MPSLIERPQITTDMYQVLKRHILRERDKKKLELEQNAEFERIKKEREQKKRDKEQEDTLTLGQTKEQVSAMDKKLESLKEEKHQLFSELKKVLHQEDETRRRAQLKEHNELASMGQHPSYMTGSAHPMFLQTTGHMAGRPTLYKPAHHMLAVSQGLKRQRSPSPPPASIYHQYPDGKYGQAAYVQAKPGAYTPGQTKHANYQQTTAGHVYPGNQSGHAYQQQQSGTYSAGQSAASGKYAPGQSAFSSYPGHYTAAKQLEHYPASGYARLQQPGYIGGHGSALPLQQQLEHASQKSGFSADDKYKLQQSAMRGMTALTPQQQALQQVHAAAAQQAQPKGGIVSGYPVRTQAQSSSSSYPPPGRQPYASQQNGSQRPHGYHHTGQQRFF